MKVVYVSGKMTGLKGMNFDEFNRVSELLKKEGYEVINPARYGIVEGWEWEDYMKKCISDLVDADIVATLPNWNKSRGASIEVFIAAQLGIDIVNYEELIR